MSVANIGQGNLAIEGFYMDMGVADARERPWGIGAFEGDIAVQTLGV
jgi:hypothetical protein